MVDGADPPEQRFDRHRTEIGLDEAEPATPLERGQVPLLAGAAVVPAEAVDRDHLVTVVEQGLTEMGADEPGRPRHQCHHLVALLAGPRPVPPTPPCPARLRRLILAVLVRPRQPSGVRGVAGGIDLMTLRETGRVPPGFLAMPGAISAPASWTPAGCRPASAAGRSTPASGPCASPTAPTGSTWTGCTPAATTPRPEHGHGSVLTAATAVLTGSPGPRDGGGRSDPAAVASRHVKGPVGVRALPRAVPERRRGSPDPHLGVRPRARGGQDRVRL